MHGYDGWHMDGWHMGGMWLWWILIAVVVGGAVWYFVRASRRGKGGAGESPELALKRRYAKGEFDRETYERMLADLRG